ncbi:hypothetical protein PPL_00732 [Heterostelium album PN500]|uniref:Uncharacterized protein n=1 Tax=Heterostelium pallidum (strain ATCC 26659 / Pp 5 / PN500) TaxID=670386 RepID=D3AXA1_HETP5|nr:hypothetical protein PPL_00732 [Heterostelium album PN500]EFA86170.1 hypothetical protein PPL_00732 [Heterostelium album PN500]|eukprot:XP_020438275.1 hypothetical protein PPL_00732 [Heterostelium album PN500]
MKSQLSFIALFVLLCCSIVQSVVYLEMTPYADDNCTKENGISGVGYAFIANQCFGVGDTAPGAKNFFVTIGGNNENATITTYKNYDPTCQDAIPDAYITYENGGCYRAPTYANQYYYVVNNFVRVTIVENPQAIPLYGRRFTTFGDSQCSSNPQWYYFYTNGTTFTNGQETSTFYCTENNSFLDVCNKGDPSSCQTYIQNQECYRDVWNLHEHNYFLSSC